MGMNNRIKKARTYARLSQTELGSQVGVTLRQIQNYEWGASEPPASTIMAIANATGVTVNYLLGDFPRLPGWKVEFVLPLDEGKEQTAETALEVLLKETDFDLELKELEEDGLSYTQKLLDGGWLEFFGNVLVGFVDGPYHNKEAEELFRMLVK